MWARERLPALAILSRGQSRGSAYRRWAARGKDSPKRSASVLSIRSARATRRMSGYCGARRLAAQKPVMQRVKVRLTPPATTRSTTPEFVSFLAPLRPGFRYRRNRILNPASITLLGKNAGIVLRANTAFGGHTEKTYEDQLTIMKYVNTQPY